MTDTPTIPPEVTWKVTAQQETTQPGPAGTYAKGVNVFFLVSTGEAGSVFIPNNVYNADNIKVAINARVAQLVAVSQLKSD